jgi:hypothetical protein
MPSMAVIEIQIALSLYILRFALNYCSFRLYPVVNVQFGGKCSVLNCIFFDVFQSIRMTASESSVDFFNESSPAQNLSLRLPFESFAWVCKKI